MKNELILRAKLVTQLATDLSQVLQMNLSLLEEAILLNKRY